MNPVVTFKIASQINSFISDSLVNLGKQPSKTAVRMVIWRLSNTGVGTEVLNRYAKALKRPALWHETAVLMLQNLSRLIRATNLCATSFTPSEIDSTLARREERSLQDLASGVMREAARNGYHLDDALSYIVECRNIYVHSGIIPYIIESGGVESGLNDFLRHKFSDNHVVLATRNVGVSMFNEEGNPEKYRALCNLILAVFSMCFDSAKPAVSRKPLLYDIGLFFSVARNVIAAAIQMVFGTISAVFVGGVGAIYATFYICVIGVIAIIILLVAKGVIGLFADDTKHNLADTTPEQLTEWMSEMTPYEQMHFLKFRNSALSTLGITYKIGDDFATPADSVTLRIYEQFKDYPDPTVHPCAYVLPNLESLSRNAFFGWPMRYQWGGEKLFTQNKNKKERIRTDSMPIYTGGYYPIFSIGSDRYANAANVVRLADKLKTYRKLDALILYNSNAKNDADEVKRALVAAGARSQQIRMFCEPTSRSSITIAIGGISNYR